jgi:ketosteroid isomerase-like protein
MQIRILVAMVGIAGILVVTAHAQQVDAMHSQLRQRLDALGQTYDEACENGDATALAATFVDDAVLVTERGPVYGREAIEKYYTAVFQKVHFHDWITTTDQYSPHALGAAGDEVWETGKWSGTVQGQNFGPVRIKGYVSSIAVCVNDVWKKRMLMSVVARNNQLGMDTSIAVPTTAQQKDRPDPQILEQLAALSEKIHEAFDNGDAAALALTYTEDAVLVTDTGPVYGREAIEKYYLNLFNQVHFSNQTANLDQFSPHSIGAAGNEVWSNGGWSTTIEVNGGGSKNLKGYWSSIVFREGDIWKRRMQILNVTP